MSGTRKALTEGHADHGKNRGFYPKCYGKPLDKEELLTWWRVVWSPAFSHNPRSLAWLPAVSLLSSSNKLLLPTRLCCCFCTTSTPKPGPIHSGSLFSGSLPRPTLRSGSSVRGSQGRVLPQHPFQCITILLFRTDHESSASPRNQPARASTLPALAHDWFPGIRHGTQHSRSSMFTKINF